MPPKDRFTTTPRPGAWPRPPAAIPHARLAEPPNGARVCVAGLVLVRQRPGTARGVIFITLEDETGIANVIVWRALYERYRRAVIGGRLLRVTGRLQQLVQQRRQVFDPFRDHVRHPAFALQPAPSGG